MSILLVIAKSVLLVVVAIAAFMSLAYALGVDPLPGSGVIGCDAATLRLCLFTIV